MRADAEANRQAVLDYLVREADLDGLATVSQQEIGDALGITKVTVSNHLASLAGEGVITNVGRVKGVMNRPIIEWQLAESVMA